MPILAAALDFSKLEARNIRAHQLGTAPSSPVTGQFYYNTGDNTLYWWDGSQWVSARGGAAAIPPATAGALGTIQLAGDLAGTATSPQIAAGVITDAEVATANKDGANGTPSLRTLGSSAGQAMPGVTRLDQIAPPVAPVSLNAQQINNLGAPSVSTDAATKLYVDQVAQGLDAKASVRVVATTSLGAGGAPSGAQTIDGVAMVDGDRALLTGQSSGEYNGIWTVVTSGAWTRAQDSDNWFELVSAYTWVEEGTVNKDTGWTCTVDRVGTIGITPNTWVQFSGASQIIAGNGLTKTGNQLDVGVGGGLMVNADAVQVAANGISQSMMAANSVDLSTATVTGTLPVSKGGTGSTTGLAARIALGVAFAYTFQGPPSTGSTWDIDVAAFTSQSRSCIVQISDAATGVVEIPDVTLGTPNATSVRVTFGASVTLNTKRVTVLGVSV